MSEDNKAVARRAVEEMFARGKLDLVEELYGAGFVGHDPADPAETRGHDGIRMRTEGYRAAFPDLQISVDDQFGEGDRVCTRWTARGTHEGELAGIPPTGKHVVVEGLTIDRLEDGKIVETWDNWDALGMMQQLGVIPQEEAATA